MAYKIIWTERASGDLAAVVRYIARHNQDAARKMGLGIYERTQILMEFPEAGSVVRELSDPNWRHLVVRPYRIIYHLNHPARTVEIVRVWHGARANLEVPPEYL